LLWSRYDFKASPALSTVDIRIIDDPLAVGQTAFYDSTRAAPTTCTFHEFRTRRSTTSSARPVWGRRRIAGRENRTWQLAVAKPTNHGRGLDGLSTKGAHFFETVDRCIHFPSPNRLAKQNDGGRSK
jgi:hypothetical protein